MTITEATHLVIERYLEKINKLFIEENDTLILNQLFQLKSMCHTMLSENLTEDKMSRWLGYIQGVMTVYKWIDVQEERDFTRPIFHEAYKSMKIDKPKTINASDFNLRVDITAPITIQLNKSNIMNVVEGLDVDVFKILTKLDFDFEQQSSSIIFFNLKVA